MLARAAVAIVEASCRRAALVALFWLAATVASGLYAARTLGVNTNTEDLISRETPWRNREIAFDAAFPQTTDLTVVVVEADRPDAAEDAASALAARLEAQSDLFKTVRRPDGGPFFERHGLLFLPEDELQAIAAQLIEAQPLIGTLTGDPSVRGLFSALNLALEGAKLGEIGLVSMERAFAAVARSVQAAADGRSEPLSWQTLLTGRTAAPSELRRFILVQGVLDYGGIQSGKRSSDAIRKAAAELDLTPENGVRVRLTGTVPLADEEFVTVSEGMGLATASSITLVTLLLFLALRSLRIIVSVLATLLSGLVMTAAFAAAAVGTLNLISVAFAVLFVGIAVDFGIQFSVRLRDERHRTGRLGEAMARTAGAIGAPLTVAALAAAFGFLSFLPTDYLGVAELGLIAGAGMGIALALNLTLLPALQTLLKPGGEPEPVGYEWAAPVDRFLLARRRSVLAAAGVAAALCLALSLQLRFDFNPLNLKDPRTESAATMFDLMADPLTTPFTIDVLAPSLDEARRLAERLDALADVERAVTLASFIPEGQEAKLAIVQDLAMVLAPTFALPAASALPTTEETLAEIAECARRLSELPEVTENPSAVRLLAALERFLKLNPPPLDRLRGGLLAGLDRRFVALREALEAGPVTIETIPESLRRDWVAPDGQARIEVTPTGDTGDNARLRRFAAAVRTVTPAITGSALTMQESGRTVVRAFETAGLAALLGITALLAVLLRRPHDVFLVLAPLFLAALLTAGTMVALGMPLNFANIIALPLLLGVGVAFNIYFVMNWRAGRGGPLQSSLARAIVFSGFTTGVAFGSLALSGHPGTASMGLLLAIMLFHVLVTTLLVLPALLGPPPEDPRAP